MQFMAVGVDEGVVVIELFLELFEGVAALFGLGYEESDVLSSAHHIFEYLDEVS